MDNTTENVEKKPCRIPYKGLICLILNCAIFAYVLGDVNSLDVSSYAPPSIAEVLAVVLITSTISYVGYRFVCFGRGLKNET